MRRLETRYVCQSCAAEVPRWEGQCRACGEWNTLVETVATPAGRTAAARRPASTDVITALRDLGSSAAPRTSLGSEELDRVLGGGIVPGSVVLLAGEPGIGKSTLALGVAAAVAGTGATVVYVAGEESATQLHLRARRLGLLATSAGESLCIAATGDVDAIIRAVAPLAPSLVIVDSIQSLTTADLDGPAGSVGQVRECAHRLLELAKADGVPVVLVGHVTKEGSVAGPKTLEHLVDVVVSLDGDPASAVRLLTATKNRFGSTEEVGLFEMTADGLRPVADPATFFAPAGTARPAGSAMALLMEGTRPLVVEVQALVGGGGYGPPRRTTSGIDLDRLALITAVLGRRAGVGVGTHDVYATLAGGLRSRDTALDLPLALALASSLRDRPITEATVAAGEVSLAGELRSIPGLERRLREAARLGYRRAIVAGAGTRELAGLTIVGVSSVREALAAADGRPAD